VISFLVVGIYWGNHHNILHAVKGVNSRMMLANLHLLFWLSIVPAATAWMGENEFEANTVALYGGVLVCCGIAFEVLRRQIVRNLSKNTALREAFDKQRRKVMLSSLLSIGAIPLAYVHPAISLTMFSLHSVIWLIPDMNIEKALTERQEHQHKS
jgi:uncharacterized membrane protein